MIKASRLLLLYYYYYYHYYYYYYYTTYGHAKAFARVPGALGSQASGSLGSSRLQYPLVEEYS